MVAVPCPRRRRPRPRLCRRRSVGRMGRHERERSWGVGLPRWRVAVHGGRVRVLPTPSNGISWPSSTPTGALPSPRRRPSCSTCCSATVGRRDGRRDRHDRPRATPTAGESALLTGFLDFYRAVMVRKAQGLTGRAAGGAPRPVGPDDRWADQASRLRRGHLVHSTAGRQRAGRAVGRVNWQADPDWDFHSAVDDEPEYLSRLYDEACARSRAAVAEVGDLDAMTKFPNRSRRDLQHALGSHPHDRGDRPPRRPRRPHPREHRRHHRRLTAGSTTRRRRGEAPA